MVRELFVREGKYVNLFDNARKDSEGRKEQPSLLGQAKSKKDAIKLGKEKEKEGWKLVSIRAISTYGVKKPYRYDIESWGGFKE